MNPPIAPATNIFIIYFLSFNITPYRQGSEIPHNAKVNELDPAVCFISLFLSKIITAKQIPNTA